MAWWAAASLGVQAASAASSFFSSREKARLERRETDEQVRRLRRQQEYTLGTARAAGAASGVEFESESLQRYLADMDTEFRRQREWTKKAGYKRAAVTDQAGAFGLGADLGSALIGFGRSNNWWKGA